MSEWKATTLGGISISIQYGYTESASSEPIGPKFLRITDIQDNFIDWDSVPYCKINNEEFKKYKLNKGDICIARTGNSTGATAFIKDDVEAVFASYLIRYQLDTRKAQPDFVGFLLRSSYWYKFVQSVKGGSAQAGANANSFASFPILLPSLKEQEGITAVLSCFDRKIENLRKQNKTLETLAHTLFKHWFVDFEFPNEDGKPYKSSGGAMERSDVKRIPAGWRVGKLGEVVNVNAKSISNGYKHTNIEYVDISSVGIGNLEGTSSYHLKDAPSRARRLVTHGDVIWSGVRPNRKSYLFISHPPENLVISTGFITLTPILIPSSYLYTWVTTDSFVEYLTFNASGSAYPAVKAEHFEIADILLPEKPILNKFHSVVDPMREKIHQNALHIQTLTKTRDVLLPKLMSGKLQISE